MTTQRLLLTLAYMVQLFWMPTASARRSEPDACPLWLAPSYVTEQSADLPKFGLYAGQNYEQNSTLPFSELVIPLIDFFGDENRLRPYGEEILGWLENFMWNQDKIGSQWEGDVSSPGMIPGVGILANYHATYSNADFLQASVLLREPGDEFPKAGEASPMRGAITPYFNATLKATQNIPAGMEIFADFGEVWDGNFTENVYQDKIHRYDYHLADMLVEKILELYDKHPNLSLDMKEDVMDFLVQNVLTTVAGPNAKTIHSLIPANPRKLKMVQESGGTFMYRYRDMIRSQEWLEENGFCLDAIRQGVSTIPNAGRGAFATRDIEEGETITITPLIHVADKNIFTSEPFLDEESGRVADGERTQLIMNYAFGHPESNMVFLPTGPQVTLINNGGQEHSNAEIHWADNADVISSPPSFLYYSADQMATVGDTVLVMKVVAKEKILEGDEITINYGTSWQQAWDAHVQGWKASREGKPHPLKAMDMREIYKNKPFETMETIVESPYPEGVIQACYLFTRERPDGTQMTNQEFGTEIRQFESPTRYEDFDTKTLFYVDVLDRKEAPGFFYNYTVRASLGPDINDFADVHDVPHSACTFYDKEFASDIHLEDAFRHPIGMPNSMIPLAWRNVLN